MRRLAVVLIPLLATACVSPSRTDRDYELKAGNSAKAVASSVATALIAVDAATHKKAFGPYLSVVLGGAEEDASAVQSQFDSVQPPSKKADDVRDALDEQLQDATGTLADLRIAVRRGELDQLASIAEPLHDVLKKLRAMSEEWQ